MPDLLLAVGEGLDRPPPPVKIKECAAGDAAAAAFHSVPYQGDFVTHPGRRNK